MCELLGMECNVPTDITFSFAGLTARGGRRAPHAHGWGLALYDGNVAHVFREPAAACASPLASFVRAHPIKTLLAIAHVRQKTRGKISLANTHPFVRELWGRTFVFAHNGTVKRVLVNGKEAKALAPNFGEWKINLDNVSAGAIRLEAHAEDTAGNVEKSRHVMIR